ncbi:TPA: phage/plasmid primase, P4 family [Clostridium perfringens]
MENKNSNVIDINELKNEKRQTFNNLKEFKDYILDLTQDSKKLKTDIKVLNGLVNLINNGLEKPFTEKDLRLLVTEVSKLSFPTYCDPKGNVITYRLAQHIVNNTNMFSDAHNIYVYKNGVYSVIEERQLHNYIYSLIPLDTNKTSNRAKEVIESIRTITYSNKTKNHNKRYINVLNGVIDIESKKLLEHNPNFKTTLQFKANYIEEEKFKELFETSTFKKFLETTLSEKNIVTLQEMFGLILSPHAKEVQKSFILLGDGSNGKSAVADIIVGLLGGNSHISCLGFSDFEKQFDLASIEGKHLNMNTDDESTGLEKSGTFKKVIAGDPVDIERKGKDKIPYQPNMTCVIGLNKLPATADKSHGFYRRQCIITFEQTFGNEKEVKSGRANKLKDPTMIKNIIDNELDIVLAWALQGLYRLIKNNFILSENEEVDAALEEFRLDTDTVYAFFKDKITLSPFDDEKITAKVLYTAYENYCENVVMAKPQSNKNLGLGLKALGCKSVRRNTGVIYLNVILDDEIKN